MKWGCSTYISRGSGDVLQKNFEIFMPRESFWCNLRLDAKLETIKWPFLDCVVEVMNIINSRGGCRYTPYTPPPPPLATGLATTTSIICLLHQRFTVNKNKSNNNINSSSSSLDILTCTVHISNKIINSINIDHIIWSG